MEGVYNKDFNVSVLCCSQGLHSKCLDCESLQHVPCITCFLKLKLAWGILSRGGLIHIFWLINPNCILMPSHIHLSHGSNLDVSDQYYNLFTCEYGLLLIWINNGLTAWLSRGLINARDKNVFFDRTVLHICAAYGHTELITMFLEKSNQNSKTAEAARNSSGDDDGKKVIEESVPADILDINAQEWNHCLGPLQVLLWKFAWKGNSKYYIEI